MRTQPVFLVLAAVLASSAIAQNRDDDDASTTTAASTSRTSPSATPAETANTSLPDINSTPSPSSTSSEPQTTTAATTSSRTSEAPPADITSDAGRDGKPPPLPGSYSYPPPAVPPTDNAPFMQKSNAPQGTVFIAVGAILGAFGVAILVWRAVVACLLHRSVRRATLAQQVANDKSSYGPPSAPFYKYSDHASSLSLGASPAGRGTRRTTRGPIPSSTPSQTNLFFSPTAPSGGGNGANRESRFLPAGFYSAGAGAAQQGHTHSISLTNLRPDSSGHARAVQPSPPDSPNLPTPQDIGRRNLSSSTLNLNRPPSGRAPSAFLEDLLADQPEQFPPQAHGKSWNQPSNR
ncbi:hypothetical protein GGS20DRAFT_553054 [Poronia punctata]|nr:hypothetical protein GGS20DRAFT_553054 [Poronia punctata]